MTEFNTSAADRAADATVLVVDDDPAIRRSVARLVRSVGFGVKTFASPMAFLRHELPTGPACVLLDMCMEGMTGLEVQDALQRNERRVPVVFLSGRSTIPTAVAGVRHGAEDFLEKPVRAKQLLAAVNRALEHDRAGSADRLVRADMRQRLDRLTPREQQVMSLVVTGLLNKQAAAELGITEKTVKVHRARVMEKMNVESLAELVVIAERIGLTPQHPPPARASLPEAAAAPTNRVSASPRQRRVVEPRETRRVPGARLRAAGATSGSALATAAV